MGAFPSISVQRFKIDLGSGTSMGKFLAGLVCGALLVAFGASSSGSLAVDSLWKALGGGPITTHAKARAAVSKFLFDPYSAQFDELRTVRLNDLEYVCGLVNGKNRMGGFVGKRPFVYDVLTDGAIIDDEGEIAKLFSDRLAICNQSPSDTTPVATQVFPQSNAERRGPMDRADVRPLAERPRTFIATFENESEWRVDMVPIGWPKFTIVANEKPLPKRSPGQILADAVSFELKWADFKAGGSPKRPSMAESSTNIRAVTSIDPKAPEFPQAWAAFVRARKIDREIAAIERAR